MTNAGPNKRVEKCSFPSSQSQGCCLPSNRTALNNHALERQKAISTLLSLAQKRSVTSLLPVKQPVKIQFYWLDNWSFYI